MRCLGMIRNWRPMAAWWTLVCLAAAACGGGKDGGSTGPGGGVGDVAGDYLLAGANDEALPATVSTNECSPVQILNGGMRLSQDGTFEMQFNWTSTLGEAKFTSDHGHYRTDGDQFEFSSDAWGDKFEGEMDEGLLWIDYEFCTDTPGQELELAFSQ